MKVGVNVCQQVATLKVQVLYVTAGQVLLGLIQSHLDRVLFLCEIGNVADILQSLPLLQIVLH